MIISYKYLTLFISVIIYISIYHYCYYYMYRDHIKRLRDYIMDILWIFICLQFTIFKEEIIYLIIIYLYLYTHDVIYLLSINIKVDI